MYGSKPQITVVGAGAVGLSTALAILERIPSVSVSVVADKFLEETLSFGAGGYFRPEANIAPNTKTALRWARASFERFCNLAQNDPLESGNSYVSGFQLSAYSEKSLRNELVECLLGPSIRPLEKRELEMFPKEFRHGIFWTSIVTDPRYYLNYLTKQILARGGQFKKANVSSLEQLSCATSSDVVVNCTGFLASKLTDDHSLIPVRGQTIKVIAPWIRHFYFADGAYIIPGRDYVTLGGIKEFGSSNSSLSNLDRHSIWSRVTALVPSLKEAEIVQEWVGIRPQRQPIRIESEMKIINIGKFEEKMVNIVHNYGHGGHGITYSWGTAKEAANLVENCLLKAKL